MNDIDEKKYLFEEYKLIRDTAINFDKMLLDIRKSTISLAFLIFGLTIGVFGIKDEKILEFKPLDLAIGLIIIEIFMVVIFFYIEIHYRTYLIRIADLASKFEEKLKLGIELNDTSICELNCKDNNSLIGRGSISKCLKCEHDIGMGFFTRTAHYNIYISLITFGFLFLNLLLEKRIGLSDNEIIFYSIITAIIIISLFIDLAKNNIKKQELKGKIDKFDDLLFNYIFFIFSYIILIYAINYIFEYFYFIPITKSYVIAFSSSSISFIICHIFIFLLNNKK